MLSLFVAFAWIVVAIRCGLRFFKLIQRRSKDWLEILFYFSVVIIALAFLL